jgi:hypothetical protein
LEGYSVAFLLVPCLFGIVGNTCRELPNTSSDEQTRLARRHSYACKNAMKTHVVTNHKKLALENACERNNEEKVKVLRNGKHGPRHDGTCPRLTNPLGSGNHHQQYKSCEVIQVCSHTTNSAHNYRLVFFPKLQTYLFYRCHAMCIPLANKEMRV